MSTDDGSAAALVARASAVLLDFDGPICRLFAKVRAADVAADLRRYLEQRGAPVPDDGINDPLAVMRMSAGLDADILAGLHAELVRAEVRAASTAVPTRGSGEVIRGMVKRGRKVAVVSNNSAEAVHEYLALHRLDLHVSVISARRSSDPMLMKPSPYLLERALTVLRASASSAVFVGDSVADVQASIAADVRCIGYANKPGKRERLAVAGAAEVIDSISTLL
jgi:phosphoglycolate phosphatase-like HAD superfamily hydrolase